MRKLDKIFSPVSQHSSAEHEGFLRRLNAQNVVMWEAQLPRGIALVTDSLVIELVDKKNSCYVVGILSSVVQNETLQRSQGKMTNLSDLKSYVSTS